MQIQQRLQGLTCPHFRLKSAPDKEKYLFKKPCTDITYKLFLCQQNKQQMQDQQSSTSGQSTIEQSVDEKTMQNLQTLSDVSSAGKLIAHISIRTGISISDLMSEFGLIRAVAEKEFKSR